jgi:hypothetical protein
MRSGQFYSPKAWAVSDLIIERVIEILKTAPDVYVPVKQLWLMLRSDGLATDIELAQLQAMLEADDRIAFNAGVNQDSELEDDPELTADLEALGFFRGQRVKLVSRQMTKKDILAILAQQMDRLNEALQAAWESRPKDLAVEDELKGLLLVSQQLDESISQLLGELPEEDATKTDTGRGD